MFRQAKCNYSGKKLARPPYLLLQCFTGFSVILDSSVHLLHDESAPDYPVASCSATLDHLTSSPFYTVSLQFSHPTMEQNCQCNLMGPKHWPILVFSMKYRVFILIFKVQRILLSRFVCLYFRGRQDCEIRHCFRQTSPIQTS